MVPNLTSRSRLMMFAPHPDDESLACSVLLQQAVRTGAAIRVIYVTDGDDNPWPQRVLERKWRLSAADRKRWGKLRRSEALAALRVLGVSASDARFLGLPDQGLTELLMRGCGDALTRIGNIISAWAPTHLLTPSLGDTHPDHSALAVMLRLVREEILFEEGALVEWSYLVHGKSAAFFNRAQKLRESKTEKAIKERAIRCHRTQIKLSRRRFLGYAHRPERVMEFKLGDATLSDGPIRSARKWRHMLQIGVRLPVKPLRAQESRLFLLARESSRKYRCLGIRLPVRSAQIELFDYATGRRVGTARYVGNAFAGEIAVPLELFSPEHAIFIKLERPSWFFDEAGWLEIPATAHPEKIAIAKRDLIEEPSVAIR
jgi:LmbE family N-acetylglucosaminyl deacetylase